MQVMGVNSDILFPISQQQEIASTLKYVSVHATVSIIYHRDRHQHTFIFMHFYFLYLSFRRLGNESVAYYELNSIFGHDTFLLDVAGVGGAIRGHLEHVKWHYAR